MACRKVIRTKARARQGACPSSSRALRSLPASLLAAGSLVGFRQATEDAVPAEEPNARDETRPKRTFPTDEQRAEQRRAVEAWRRDKEALAKYEEEAAIEVAQRQAREKAWKVRKWCTPKRVRARS